ncbi:hypothetical protein ScPMuIL_018764 [Solemya velum]
MQQDIKTVVHQYNNKSIDERRWNRATIVVHRQKTAAVDTAIALSEMEIEMGCCTPDTADTNSCRDKSELDSNVSSNEPKQSAQCTRALYAITIAAFVLSTFSFASTCVTLTRISDLNNLKEGEIGMLRHAQTNDMCVPCSTLRQGPYADDNNEMLSLTQKTEDGVSICCAYTAEEFSKLLELFLRRKLQEYRAKEVSVINSTYPNSSTSEEGRRPGMGTPSAHLFIGLQNHPDTGRGTVRNWTLSDPQAHISGFEVGETGRLKVQKGGLYFLYSQVRFDMYHMRPALLPHQSLHHYILRYNVIYPNDGVQLLLKSSSTLCWADKKDYEDHVTSMGAALYLLPYDELYVQVSNTSLISRDPKASYFGLFKLD